MKAETNSKVEYYLFDAKGQILGRMATQIAKILSGKNKPDFTPNIGGCDWVVVVNSDRVRLSAEKGKKKIYWRHSGYPGGIYKRTFEEQMEIDSTKVIVDAVKGMMPKNKLSTAAMKRLRVFKNEENPFEKKITNTIK